MDHRDHPNASSRRASSNASSRRTPSNQGANDRSNAGWPSAASSRSQASQRRNSPARPSRAQSSRGSARTRPASRQEARHPNRQRSRSSVNAQRHVSSYGNRRSTGSTAASRPGKLWLIVAAVVLVLLILLIRLFACSGGEETQSAVDAVASVDATSTVPSAAAYAAPERDRTATSTSANDVRPTEKVVYLTFDDGPSEHTQQILDTLDEYGIKATWFVIGNTGRLDEVTDIWERGHQVGLHSNEHDYDYVYANTENFVADINTIGQAVKARLGFMPTLIRYPGGSANGYNASRASEFIAAATSNGWHYFDWNVSIGDSTQPPAPVDALFANIMREAEGCNSCCVLMHDSDFKPTTPEALPQVIEYFIDQGYTFDILTADSFGYHF